MWINICGDCIASVWINICGDCKVALYLFMELFVVMTIPKYDELWIATCALKFLNSQLYMTYFNLNLRGC